MKIIRYLDHILMYFYIKGKAIILKSSLIRLFWLGTMLRDQ